LDGSSQPDRPVIAFTRSGEFDASGSPTAPRRVGYRVRNGALERLVWTALDQVTQNPPTVTLVLLGVSRLGLRYRDAAGTWRASWPMSAGQDTPGAARAHVDRSGAVDITLPSGVDVTIELAGGEQIQRLVPLPSGSRS
jgi:general secretion pathway protein J